MLTHLALVAETITAKLLTTGRSTHVYGGRSTGKSLVAALVACRLAATHAGPIWLIADTAESAHHCGALVQDIAPHMHGRVVVLSSEDYAERRAFGVDDAAVLIFDDADRYEHDDPADDRILSCSLQSGQAFSSSAGPHGAANTYHLTETRTREEIRRTLEAMRLPGIAPLGQPSRRVLRGASPLAGRFAAAVNGWGVACIPMPRSRRETEDELLFGAGTRLLKLLSRSASVLDVADLSPPNTSGEGRLMGPRLSVTVSGARSGRFRRISTPEEKMPWVASLLEDLAADPPDVAVIVSTDDDPDHLGRLLSTPTVGALILTTAGSLTHNRMCRWVVDA